MGCFDVPLAGQNLAVGSPVSSISDGTLARRDVGKEEEMNILCVGVCAGFLRLPNKLPCDLVAQNNENVLSHSSEATSLNSRCRQGCAPSEVPRRTSPCHFGASSS